ncbi:hypothetical protein [Streptomyces sp. NPDC046685]|uniref:hypothetical protein n=1 Tax=Streptomyces sp. NPDC046685 TaxID=3157202 RepID=UPI0034080960
MVTAASVTDREAGQVLLARLRERYWRITRGWADTGARRALEGVPADLGGVVAQ